MSSVVSCLRCGQSFAASPDLSGKTVPCPSCGSGIDVPLPVADTIPVAAPRASGPQAFEHYDPKQENPFTRAYEATPLASGQAGPAANSSFPVWLILLLAIAVVGFVGCAGLVVVVRSFQKSLNRNVVIRPVPQTRLYPLIPIY